MRTDRSLEGNGHLGRAERYRPDARYLETEHELNSNNQNSSSKDQKSKDTDDIKGADKQKGKKKRKIYKTPIEDLWYFARVYRALQPRYCHHCEKELRNHHEEFFCDAGHNLHSKCAKVKWVGNNV
mmetsp:Transcript_21889/g.19432  ORF Transcript_21889/g.19432 Transcript_21889/m.19432 type:complete len:126 (+) Transcript_21889:770-1147(+)